MRLKQHKLFAENNFLFIKIVIHVLFWALFIAISLIFVSSDKHWYQNSFFKYLAVVGVVTYANELLFLPLFTKRKAYILFALFLLLIAFLATILYCNLISSCNCNLDYCLSKYLWQTIFPLVFLSLTNVLLRIFQKQKELEASRSKALEMELNFLKSQLNPHILFNNLNTIYSYALEASDKVPDMILNLSSSLKYILNESEASLVPLKKDIAYIDHYIEFMSIRNEGLKIISYEKSLEDTSLKITPLLLITIIENAFKHSSKTSGIPHIAITIVQQEKELTLTCQNDYNADKAVEDSFGIGLANLKKRLNLIYKEAYSLTITTESDHYLVKLTLPLL